MAEHDKGKEFLMGRFIGSPIPPQPPSVYNFPDRDSEEMRFDKMVELNGKQYDNGDRSQGDQEAEQRMAQNKATGLLQKFVGMMNNLNPFDRVFPDNRVDYTNPDGTTQKVNPDFDKLLKNRPDLKEKFDTTGSIYSDM